ncbi:MAG: hypothetical protein JXB49_15800 [Bacteroidales bacterium]|nr:hypothetical protein [Bacteroidales bacterium]
MKNLINIGLWIILIVFTLSCQKDTDTIADIIIGRWDWLKSVSPWTGHVSNPQTTGYTNTIEFSNQGIMKEYKNDTLTTTTNYKVEINSDDPNKSILFYDSDIRVQISIEHDSLILNSAYVDGPISFYIRKK